MIEEWRHKGKIIHRLGDIIHFEALHGYIGEEGDSSLDVQGKLHRCNGH